ncbi:hypothetical protein B9T25_06435 [Acinetobacter sp. ANC 4470]|uniref:phage baseplate assembly protein n=1 Tax=Acinetobacter sp. ANC 4470 TaxID=1977881 RepID=UPI000A34CC51|nr:hypothetical protein [Acinetobacter sp. ANC 4470]OTG68315.1 hypothetical protein B9T25_06435 [Acinetobacter sp. ANC 4470]
MLDNQNNAIRLVIAGYEINNWDNASVDSAIDTPSEGWSFSLFSKDDLTIPDEIKSGAKIQAFYGDELILTSIADAVEEGCDRSGYALKISGRDLVGQLIDCSVPIFNGRQINLEELINKYVLSGDLSNLFHDVRIQNNSWLKNKVSVEPGESLWDAIVKAAQVTGQHVWLEPDGTLVVGDPFANAYQVKTSLQLHKRSNTNNVLDAKYTEDISNVFSDIKILSQDGKGQHILSGISASTQYTHKRLKIISMSDVETKAEADTAIQKIEKDNNLQAYAMTANVVGWSIDNKVWSTGWHLNFQSNRLVRATAKWAVTGRTLTLSRSNGKQTLLKLNRQGDWAQPLLYKDPQAKTTKKAVVKKGAKK